MKKTRLPAPYGSSLPDTKVSANIFSSEGRKGLGNWLRMLALGLVLGMLELQKEETAKDLLLKEGAEWSFRARSLQFRPDTFHFPGADPGMRELAYGYNFQQRGWKTLERKSHAKVSGDPQPQKDTPAQLSTLSAPERIARLDELGPDFFGL